MDISNAFNSIRWNDILHILHKYHVPNKLKNIIKSYLTNTKVQIDNNSAIGVPQGSGLGPVFWLLIKNELK